MMRTLLAVHAAALTLVSVGVQAADTFGLTAHLDGFYQYFGGAAAVPGGCNQYSGTPDYQPCVDAGITPISWVARLSVTTASNSNGTYSGDTLDQVAYTGPYDAYVFNKGDVPIPNELGFGYPFLGAEPGASVTISDGKVSAIDITYDFVFSQVRVDGLSILDHGATSAHDASYWFMAGDVVPDAPEPTQSVMLLAGLCTLAMLKLQRRRLPGRFPFSARTCPWAK